MAKETFGTIRQSRTIPAKPVEVYEAYLDSKKHSEFTGSPAKLAPKVGGKFTAWDGYIFGKTVELQKGKKIVQEWTTTEWPSGYPPSRLELTFKAKGGATEVVMVHSRVPAEQVDSYRQGWIDAYWEPMKAYFERKE